MAEISTADYRLRRRNGHGGLSGAHPCLGGCGRAVSGTKLRCLDCLIRATAADLTARGVPASEEECRREFTRNL